MDTAPKQLHPEANTASATPLWPCRGHADDFAVAAQAVLFCLETQYRLLESAWPAEVLNLPSCKEVTATDGSLLFRGPRVRMGIHWAGEGTVAHRYSSLVSLLHCITHMAFSMSMHWAGEGTVAHRYCPLQHVRTSWHGLLKAYAAVAVL